MHRMTKKISCTWFSEDKLYTKLSWWNLKIPGMAEYQDRLGLIALSGNQSRKKPEWSSSRRLNRLLYQISVW